MAKLVSKTYGDALFELALENDTVDTLYEEAMAVDEVFLGNDELIKLLNHPKIDKDKKIQIIEEIFKGKVSDDMTGFLTVIVRKDRYNDIDNIMKCFIDEVREYKKIGVAYVTSAIELSDKQKKDVEKRLLDTTQYEVFDMNYTVDERVIGGMIIRIGDRVVDSTIKSKIEKMSRELLKIQLA